MVSTMDSENATGDTSAELNTISTSREKRAESARAWQEMQYMGGMPDADAAEEPAEDKD